MHLSTWFAELRRRRVWRALAFYAIATFAVLQVAEPVMHGLHLPEWVLSLVLILLGLGFPVTVGLAWAFDVQAAGVVRTAPAGVAAGAPPHSRARLAALLLGLAALSGAGVFLASRWLRPAPPPPSIAVLAFADMSPGHDQEHFSDGVAEEILNALAEVQGLRVAGRTSAFSFKGKNEDLRSIGKQLGVGAVLEGSVRREGTRLRVTAHVVDVKDGYHLWSETFDGEVTGVFAVQDRIARAVVGALRVRLATGGEAPARPRAATSPEVYGQYLLGQQLVARGTVDDSRRAVELAESAVARDPRYAPAHALLAVALGNLAIRAFSAESAALAEKALEAADRAVGLDGQLAKALGIRGWLRTVFRWDWDGAGADLERALALAPGDPNLHVMHGVLVQKLGRLGEAIAETRRGLEIDPLDAVGWSNLGAFLTQAGELAQARQAVRRSVEISGTEAELAFLLAGLECLEGHCDRALPILARERNDVARLVGQAAAYHALGRARESREALDALVRRAGRFAPYAVAQAHAQRGETDAAFEWLERAHAQHDVNLRHVKVDVSLRSLRGDARFRELLARMKLPQD